MKQESPVPVFDNFGHWLRYWRGRAGLTQTVLGNAVGVKKQHISNLENGVVSSHTGEVIKPSFDLLLKLTKRLQRPLKEAVGLAGYELPEIKPVAQVLPITRESVEAALHRAGYFEEIGIDEMELATLRPLMEAMDRMVDQMAAGSSVSDFGPKLFSQKGVRPAEGRTKKAGA